MTSNSPHPAATISAAAVPFPSMKNTNPKDSPESQTTTSDKLSALPTSLSWSPGPPHSPRFNHNRFFRPSPSLPAFPAHSPSISCNKEDPMLKWNRRRSMSDRSVDSYHHSGQLTPRAQRSSLDLDRTSLKSLRKVNLIAFRKSHGQGISEPPSPNSAQNASPRPHHRRSASPLQVFQQWSNMDLFIPIDPFSLRANRIHVPSYCILPCPVTTTNENQTLARFITDTLLCHIYLNILLRLPALYFTRVARIFQDAEMSRPDIERLTRLAFNSAGYQITMPTLHRGSLERVLASHSNSNLNLQFDQWSPSLVSPALSRFKVSWEAFIDTLLREWKTLNVLSALLLSAILTIFQIPGAASDVPTRSAAFLSLICALMSLCYGCVYIVRFGAMRSMYRACHWAEEARKTDAYILWNVWVMLAMPAVWMAWSMILFFLAILLFVWRVHFDELEEESSQHTHSGSRATSIAVTFLFVVGLVYFGLIVKTLRRWSFYSHGDGYDLSRQDVPLAVPATPVASNIGMRLHISDSEGQPETGNEVADVDEKKSNTVGLGLRGIEFAVSSVEK